MIRHIVFFAARNPSDREHVLEGLKILTQIRHASKIEVAANRKLDQLGNDVDFVVYAEFADTAALAAFKADPLYEESIRRVRPLRGLRIAADFDAV